jgi:hypothetical protein
MIGNLMPEYADAQVGDLVPVAAAVVSTYHDYRKDPDWRPGFATVETQYSWWNIHVNEVSVPVTGYVSAPYFEGQRFAGHRQWRVELDHQLADTYYYREAGLKVAVYRITEGPFWARLDTIRGS